ncbi:hypothetical protein D3C73_1341680 [compost metagenome]
MSHYRIQRRRTEKFCCVTAGHLHRDTVKAIAPHGMGPVGVLRNGIVGGEVGNGAMERRVEDGHLWEIRPSFAGDVNAGDTGRVVERRQGT